MESVQLARPRDNSCERERGCRLCLQNFGSAFFFLSSPAKDTIQNTQVKARGKTEVTTQKRATGGAGAAFTWCFLMQSSSWQNQSRFSCSSSVLLWKGIRERKKRQLLSFSGFWNWKALSPHFGVIGLRWTSKVFVRSFFLWLLHFFFICSSSSCCCFSLFSSPSFRYFLIVFHATESERKLTAKHAFIHSPFLLILPLLPKLLLKLLRSKSQFWMNEEEGKEKERIGQQEGTNAEKERKRERQQVWRRFLFLSRSHFPIAKTNPGAKGVPGRVLWPNRTRGVSCPVQKDWTLVKDEMYWKPLLNEIQKRVETQKQHKERERLSGKKRRE